MSLLQALWEKKKKEGMLTTQQEFSLNFIYGSSLIVVIPHTDIDKLCLSCLRRQLFLLVLFESGAGRPWARALAKVHGFIDHCVCHVKNNLFPSGVMPLGRSRHMNTWEEGARGREICVTPQS